MISHVPRKKGGAFDYRTALRPQQIYNFYLATMGLRGAWTAGGSPIVEDKAASFRFYTTYVPRLALFDVSCDDTRCTVHVEY
jgi:hypothetical protein